MSLVCATASAIRPQSSAHCESCNSALAAASVACELADRALADAAAESLAARKGVQAAQARVVDAAKQALSAGGRGAGGALALPSSADASGSGSASSGTSSFQRLADPVYRARLQKRLDSDDHSMDKVSLQLKALLAAQAELDAEDLEGGRSSSSSCALQISRL